MKFASRSTLGVRSTLRPWPIGTAAAAARPPAGTRAAVLAAPVRFVPAGKSFARKRIEHAVELTGACIMLAVFLVLALLG